MKKEAMKEEIKEPYQTTPPHSKTSYSINERQHISEVQHNEPHQSHHDHRNKKATPQPFEKTTLTTPTQKHITTSQHKTQILQQLHNLASNTATHPRRNRGPDGDSEGRQVWAITCVVPATRPHASSRPPGLARRSSSLLTHGSRSF